MIAKNNRDDLALLAGLVGAGRVTPVVERTYPLVELPEALRHLGEGHARAKIAVTV